jgi:two-component system, cell cycle response regulator DivK
MRNETIVSGLNIHLKSIAGMLKNNSENFTQVKRATPFVLVESNDFDTRFLFTTLLKMWMFECVESSTTEDSLLIAAEKVPAVWLLDCGSPFDDNLTKIRLLRENEISRRIPIVAVSGFAQSNYRKMILEAGADHILIKPVDFERLETLIRKNIEKFSQTKIVSGEHQ